MRNIQHASGKRKTSATVDKRFSRWIRKYIDSLNDPKIVKLSDHEYRKWDQMLLIAGMHDTGALPSIDDMAVLWRCSVNDAKLVWDRFIDLGLIDLCGGLPGHPTAFRPHNWAMRQYRGLSSTERSRKLRGKRKIEASNGYATECNVACNGSASILSESVSSFFNKRGVEIVAPTVIGPSKKVATGGTR
jgi:hypothetical protein